MHSFHDSLLLGKTHVALLKLLISDVEVELITLKLPFVGFFFSLCIPFIIPCYLEKRMWPLLMLLISDGEAELSSVYFPPHLSISCNFFALLHLALLGSMGANRSTRPEAVAALEKNAALLTASAGSGDLSAIPLVCRVSPGLPYAVEFHSSLVRRLEPLSSYAVNSTELTNMTSEEEYLKKQTYSLQVCLAFCIIIPNNLG
ncbi:augmin subunit 5 [Quercus suber]|uniref:Augmin subunit 5 n=1 Tax=Quercus suber TaxID=58331 RepID=A0AAW0IMR6_QUESU